MAPCKWRPGIRYVSTSLGYADTAVLHVLLWEHLVLVHLALSSPCVLFCAARKGWCCCRGAAWRSGTLRRRTPGPTPAWRRTATTPSRRRPNFPCKVGHMFNFQREQIPAEFSQESFVVRSVKNQTKPPSVLLCYVPLLVKLLII